MNENEEELKPIKCWYCRYLGKCQKLAPCERFEEYEYKTGDFTMRDISAKLGISEKTFYRKIKNDKTKLLQEIKEKLGLDLDCVIVKKKRCLVVRYED